MQIAAFSLAEAAYATGGGDHLRYQVQESAKAARFPARIIEEDVFEVLLPVLKSFIATGSWDIILTGPGRGSG